MVKTKGPAHSLEASGRLADVLIFSKSPNRNYVKKYAKPSNPKSVAQIAVRIMTGFLARDWRILSPAEKITWTSLASKTKLANYRAYVSANARRWNHFLTPSKEDPASGAGLRPQPNYLLLNPLISGVVVRCTIGSTHVPWGHIIYRSMFSGFTPSKATAVAVVHSEEPMPTYWTDTPLEPGTYYYRQQAFSPTGLIGNISAEKVAVVA